jgi:hypothetical protein
MLVGLIALRPAYAERARVWWDVALANRVRHHFEHAFLSGQALAGKNLFGSKVPVSILQLVVPRVELHLFYYAVVFIPMPIATWYHIFPIPAEASACTCSHLGMWHRPRHEG